MSRSSVLASLASQDVSASEFDKLDADNGSDYQGQIDLKSPLASPTFTGSITTPEIRSGSTLTIDPATVGDNTGLVLLKGNLQVDGTSTTINSTTLTVDDLNLTLASGAADSAAANGAGITIDGASATMTYTHSTTSFDFNKTVNVTGKVTATTLRSGLGSESAPAIEIGDDDTGLFDAGSNAIGFTTGATERMRIDGSGNVGIGDTSPTQKLEINGDVRISDGRSLFFNRIGDNYAFRIRNESATGTDPYSTGWDGSNKLVFEVVSNSNTQADPGDSSHSVYTNSANQLVLKENGYLGIGTASPTQKLTVNGNIDMTDIMRFGGNNGSLYFQALGSGNGKVGIGTTSPTRDLHVSNDGYIGGFNFLTPVSAYRITTGTATRNVKLHSSGGECWGKLTLVGLWPYTGSGFGTVTVEFAAMPQEGRVSVIETVKKGGGSNVTVTVTGDDANDLINFQITTTSGGWRFAALCELIYGNTQAYLTIDGTDG